MGSGRCQTQTDTKPIAIYVKSYSSCVPIHCRHMNIQLHLNFSSRALPKSCHLHTAKSIVFSVAVWGQNRFYSDRYWYCFLGALQTEMKPIQNATCKLALPGFFGCGSLRPIQNRQQSVAKSYLSCVPPHMHVQLRLNFSSRALLKSCCVSCSKFNCSQFCSSGPELSFWIGRPSILLSARPIQFENPHLSYGMWQGARLRPIQNRQQSVMKSYLSCVPIHSHTCTLSSA